MVSIARKNLLEDIPRFLVAQAGIMFAVSLVTIQTGIFQGVIHSTISLVTDSPADIWITSRRMVHLELTEPILFEIIFMFGFPGGPLLATRSMLMKTHPPKCPNQVRQNTAGSKEKGKRKKKYIYI